jgi:hypothetical protein
MTDRLYITILLLGCILALLALVWVVDQVAEAPRSAHGGAGSVDPVSSQRLIELSDQMTTLTRRIEQIGIPGAGAGGLGARPPLELPAGQIPVNMVAVVPVDDPLAPEWETAAAVTINLERQDQTMPMLETVNVPSITVRAMSDGRRIAWHMSWDDAQADYPLDTDRFCDAVAIQFPLKANAAYTMGARDFPVQIIQWKAIWQKDIDEHFQDVQDLHPNYWADLYWFADGQWPYRVPDDFTRTESLDWFIAYRAGNPMADMYRRIPVQEMFAEGFGTLIQQPDSISIGRGVWRDGRWSVVIARPMETTDASDFQFTPGTRSTVAFAVWDGAAENVAGRHQQTQWVVFEVQ